MSPEMIELAKRAVACKGFRWMPGMRAVGKFPNYPVRIHGFGENVQDPDDMLAADKWLPWQQPVEYGDHTYDGPYLPDLSDPATLGCLLALVREVRAAPRALVRLSSNGKSFHVFDVDRVTAGGNWAAWLSDDRCPSEAHALVAALEAK